MEYIFLGVAVIILILIFSQFSPSSTQKIIENLYVVRCGIVNFYVYKTDNGAILFDTGISKSFAKRGLTKLGISPETVTHIFLTHTDYDHMGGILAFPKAEIYISKEEEQMINGETSRRGFLHNSRLSKYHTLNDGESVILNDISIKINVKPGHTPGSAIYLINNLYFVTGDLLRISKNGNVKPFLWLMNKNHKQNIQSVSESQSIINSVEYILTGHTGFYKSK